MSKILDNAVKGFGLLIDAGILTSAWTVKVQWLMRGCRLAIDLQMEENARS
jgi:hypothetical protein